MPMPAVGFTAPTDSQEQGLSMEEMTELSPSRTDRTASRTDRIVSLFNELDLRDLEEVHARLRDQIGLERLASAPALGAGSGVDKLFHWQDMDGEEKMRNTTMELALSQFVENSLRTRPSPAEDTGTLLRRSRAVRFERFDLFERTDAHMGLEECKRLLVAGLKASTERRRQCVEATGAQAVRMVEELQDPGEATHLCRLLHVLMGEGSRLQINTPLFQWLFRERGHNLLLRWADAYYASVRLRGMLFIGTTTIILLSGLLGFVFETFGSAHEYGLGKPTNGERKACMVMYWMLPILIIGMALVCQLSLELFLDVLATPPLSSFQASLLTLAQERPCDIPTARACRIIDFGIIIFGEVLPITYCLVIGPLYHLVFQAKLGRSYFSQVHKCYFWAANGAALLAIIVFGTSRIYTSARVVTRRRFADAMRDFRNFRFCHRQPVLDNWLSLWETRESLRRCISSTCTFPGQLGTYREVTFACNHIMYDSVVGSRELDAMRMKVRRQAGRFFGKEIWIAVLSWVTWVLLDLGLHSNWYLTKNIFGKEDVKELYGVPCVVAALIPVITCWSRFIEHRYPKIITWSYWTWLSVFFFFFFVTILLQFLQNVLREETARGAQVVEMGTRVYNWTGNHLQYGICSRSWGSKSAPLSSLDISQLAGLAYVPRARIEQDVKAREGLFPGRNISRVKCDPYKEVPRICVYDFEPDQADGGKGTRVIAFKGTSVAKDIYADATLWSSIKVMQLVSMIFPVLSAMSLGQAQWFIGSGFFHNPWQQRQEQRFWKEEIVDRVSEEARKQGNSSEYEIVLTGHSLGGGFAAVASGRNGYPALVFSSPGTLYSAIRFGLHKEHFDVGTNALTDELHNLGVQVSQNLLVNVIPEFDYVPQVDAQAGSIQKIMCRDSTGKGVPPFGCHSLRRTGCELYRMCGDHAGLLGERFFNCTAYNFNMDVFGKWFSPDTIGMP